MFPERKSVHYADRLGDVFCADNSNLTGGALMPTQRKGCAITRSFSHRVTDRVELEQAVATYAARLCEELRRGGLATNHLGVFSHISEHGWGEPMRSVSTTVGLPEATSDSLALREGGRAEGHAEFGVRRKMLPADPAKGVKLYKIESRERFLLDREVIALAEALAVREEEAGISHTMATGIRPAAPHWRPQAGDRDAAMGVGGSRPCLPSCWTRRPARRRCRWQGLRWRSWRIYRGDRPASYGPRGPVDRSVACCRSGVRCGSGRPCWREHVP